MQRAATHEFGQTSRLLIALERRGRCDLMLMLTAEARVAAVRLSGAGCSKRSGGQIEG